MFPLLPPVAEAIVPSRARRATVAMLGLALLSCADGSGPKPTETPTPVTPTPTPPVVTPGATIPLSWQPIAAALDSNPPSVSTSNSARTAPLERFETQLWQFDPAQIGPNDVQRYYEARMARVAREIEQPVTTGFRIWAMYNDGFIVKTPTTVFAFDLVEGKTNWLSPAWPTRLSDTILNTIDVLMVSHEHVDHWDITDRIPAAIKARGGAVLYPSAGLPRPSVTRPMLDQQVVPLRDLRITAYAGMHNAAVMIYEVVTGDGYRIVHTGDNQTSVALPALQGADVLLLNGWVNESGSTSSVEGMMRSVAKIRPAVMIPGHFAEISRPQTGWYRYTDGLVLQNDPQQRTRTIVMTWGESVSFTRPPCASGLIRVYQNCEPIIP